MGRSKEQMSENTRCGYTLLDYSIMTQCIILCYTIMGYILLIIVIYCYILYYIVILEARA
jgi:hypothetical protein